MYIYVCVYIYIPEALGVLQATGLTFWARASVLHSGGEGSGPDRHFVEAPRPRVTEAACKHTHADEQSATLAHQPCAALPQCHATWPWTERTGTPCM